MKGEKHHLKEVPHTIGISRLMNYRKIMLETNAIVTTIQEKVDSKEKVIIKRYLHHNDRIMFLMKFQLMKDAL